jgi:hypothetical protein
VPGHSKAAPKQRQTYSEKNILKCSNTASKLLQNRSKTAAKLLQNRSKTAAKPQQNRSKTAAKPQQNCSKTSSADKVLLNRALTFKFIYDNDLHTQEGFQAGPEGFKQWCMEHQGTYFGSSPYNGKEMNRDPESLLAVCDALVAAHNNRTNRQQTNKHWPAVSNLHQGYMGRLGRCGYAGL